MKNKIDELLIAAKNIQVEKAKHLEEAEAAQLVLERAKAAEQAAAASGDMSRYIKAKAERQAAEDRAVVLAAHAESFSGGVDPGEVRAVWADYAEKANREFVKKLADFERSRHALAGQYKDLLKIQNESLKAREACAAFLDLPRDVLGRIKYDKDFGGLKLIESDTDSEYLLASGDLDADLGQACHDIINGHIPNDEIMKA